MESGVTLNESSESWSDLEIHMDDLLLPTTGDEHNAFAGVEFECLLIWNSCFRFILFIACLCNIFWNSTRIDWNPI